jgi:hypothetical protein
VKGDSVAVLCRAYMTDIEARRAVSALLAAGVPGENVRVLMGEAPRDSHPCGSDVSMFERQMPEMDEPHEPWTL